MPELPEVETIAKAIAKAIVGHRITKITFYRDSLREPIPVKQMQSQMTKGRVVAVRRRSKYILMETEAACGIFHLGMTGNFLLSETPTPRWNHTHVVFSLSDTAGNKHYLHYVDPRRFGRMSVCQRSELDDWQWFRLLGPEPLDPKVKLAAHLARHATHRHTTIKQFLMDPKIVVGVGNIYATEALFQSKIRPDCPANQLTLVQWKSLSQNVKRVLRAAIKAGGTTLRDFKDTDGKPGYFSVSLQAYGRANQPCFICNTKINQIRLGGRSSFYCPSCQA